jgi:predicted Zn finger-like uncharacterized protein
MVIECNGCTRKFNLNEDRLKPDGSKVRCTKCGNIFLAVPPAAGRRPSEFQTGSKIQDRPASAAGGTEPQTGKKKHQRIALSVPVSCISIDAEGHPLNFYIGLITEVGPAELGLDVFCSSVPDGVLVSFINLDNHDVQIRGNVVGSDTNGAGKTRLQLALAGSPPEISDFVAQLVKSYHYAN